MTQEQKIYTAIDVGTTKVCTIVGRKKGADGFEILAHSVVPCEGLRKGNVIDVTATAKAIRHSITAVNSAAGVNAQTAYVGITGAHVSFENRWDKLGWVGNRGVITADDLTLVPPRVASAASETGRHVLHAIPMTYAMDGERTIRNPLGMHAQGLEVESHVVTGTSSYVDKLVKAVESAGVQVESLVLEPLASGEAVLTTEERERGVALVDVGGGTTDVVVFKGGTINYTAVIPVGGWQFTNDICQTYSTPYPAAEEAKLKYGHTEPFTGHVTEELSLPLEGRSVHLKVPHREFCQLIRERAQELLRLIKLKLQEAKVEDISKMSLVITGGTANLPGLLDLTHTKLTNHVRIGVPNGNTSIPDELKAPAYATGVGILLWAMDQREPVTATEAPRSNGNGSGNGNGNGGRASLASRFITLVRNRLSVNLIF